MFSILSVVDRHSIYLGQKFHDMYQSLQERILPEQDLDELNDSNRYVHSEINVLKYATLRSAFSWKKIVKKIAKKICTKFFFFFNFRKISVKFFLKFFLAIMVPSPIWRMLAKIWGV
jgi:hypothetical protein